MQLVKYAFPILGLMLSGVAAQADTTQGKQLVEKNCTSCHTTSVYTRPNKQVNSLAALQHRVNGCEKPAGVKWSEQQTKDVVEYLNKEFYHFK